MPINKKAWCSWNSSLNPQNTEQSSVTYWLNQLQNLKIDQNSFKKVVLGTFFLSYFLSAKKESRTLKIMMS